MHCHRFSYRPPRLKGRPSGTIREVLSRYIPGFRFNASHLLYVHVPSAEVYCCRLLRVWKTDVPVSRRCGWCLPSVPVSRDFVDVVREFLVHFFVV